MSLKYSSVYECHECLRQFIFDLSIIYLETICVFVYLTEVHAHFTREGVCVWNTFSRQETRVTKRNKLFDYTTSVHLFLFSGDSLKTASCSLCHQIFITPATGLIRLSELGDERSRELKECVCPGEGGEGGGGWSKNGIFEDGRKEKSSCIQKRKRDSGLIRLSEMGDERSREQKECVSRRRGGGGGGWSRDG